MQPHPEAAMSQELQHYLVAHLQDLVAQDLLLQLHRCLGLSTRQIELNASFHVQVLEMVSKIHEYAIKFQSIWNCEWFCIRNSLLGILL